MFSSMLGPNIRRNDWVVSVAGRLILNLAVPCEVRLAFPRRVPPFENTYATPLLISSGFVWPSTSVEIDRVIALRLISGLFISGFLISVFAGRLGLTSLGVSRFGGVAATLKLDIIYHFWI